MSGARVDLRARFGDAVAASIARILPWIMARALRRGLRGVWRLGATPELPEGPFVLALNHHSWWDGYLAWLAVRRMDRSAVVLMDRAQLARFPFFRHAGALASTEVRAALRALEAGDVLVVFPEGGIRAPGSVGVLAPGTEFFARRSGAPVLPLAVRVALRGAPRPEAYLAFGTPIAPDEGLTRKLRASLEARLAAIDATLAASPPEDVPTEAAVWLEGRAGPRDAVAWWERTWRR